MLRMVGYGCLTWVFLFTPTLGSLAHAQIAGEAPDVSSGSDKTKNLLKWISQSKSEPEKYVEIRALFTGPRLDSNLMTFYSVLAKEYPSALKPISIEPSFKTISEAALKKQVLFRYYPTHFEREVVQPLSVSYTGGAGRVLPGLEFKVIGIPSSVKKSEAPRDKRFLCENYRVDRLRTCSVRIFGEYVYFDAQGVETGVVVPEKISGHVLKKLEEAFIETKAYLEKHVTIYTKAWAMKPQSHDTDNHPLEVTDIDRGGACQNSDFSPLKQHVRRYYGIVNYLKPSSHELNEDKGSIMVFDIFPKKSNSLVYDPTHYDLQPKRQPGKPICLMPKTQIDWDGHGLHVSGIIEAKHNGIGFMGIAPSAKVEHVIPMNSLVKQSDGRSIHFDDLLEALAYARRKNFDIVNGSIGNPDDPRRDGGSAYIRLRDWFESTIQDRLYVFAAGNNNPGKHLTKTDCPVLPGCLGFIPNVITVAALHVEGNRRPQIRNDSNYGSDVVALSAPGTNILSTDLGDVYSLRDGTSAAAPFVTGAASLIWQAAPQLQAFQIKQRLLATARLDIPFQAGSKIYSGTVDISTAIHNIYEDVVVLSRTGERLAGQIHRNFPRNTLFIYDWPRYGPGEKAENTCKGLDVLRIHRNGTRFSIMCVSRYETRGNRIGMEIHRDKYLNPAGGGMECLIRKNCLTLRHYDQKSGKMVQRNLDLLEEVDDIYFGFK